MDVNASSPVHLTDSITTQLLKVILGSYLLVAIVLTGIQMYAEYAHVKDTVSDELQSFRTTAGPGLTKSMWTINDELLLSIVTGMLENPIVAGVKVFDQEGETYLAVGTVESDGDGVKADGEGLGSEPAGDIFSRSFGHSFPVVFVSPEGISFHIGKVSVYSNERIVIGRVKHGFILILVNSVIKALVLCFIFVVFVRRFLGRPLRQLTNGIAAIEFDDLAHSTVRVNTREGNELSLLAETFNRMIDRLFGATREVKASEQRLLENRAHLRKLAGAIPDLIWRTRADGVFLGCNPAFEHFIGAREDEISSKTNTAYRDSDLAAAWSRMDREAIAAGRACTCEETIARPGDGRRMMLETIRTPVRNSAGEITEILCVGHDVTRRSQSEQALRRAQKMDAVGQLTGGIAHDFNNILGIMLGNLDLLKMQVAANEPALKRIETIEKSGRRAADLTRQLLGFSRREATEASVTDVNQLISEMESLIARSLTPQVQVEKRFTRDLGLTEIDRGDFEDALLNLVLNARDAMNGQGRLTLATANKTLDADDCARNPGVKPGRYIELSVGDIGPGIPPELEERIFEPFFTTKVQGKGTGLGLAMVFGFAQRSGGHVKVETGAAGGATFRLYLPRTDVSTVVEDRPAEQVEVSALPRGVEHILVVEDEKDLLELTRETLQRIGYRVSVAADGPEALSCLDEEPDIDLMFSDVVMPGGMNGYELAERAAAAYPRLKILLTSGHIEPSIVFKYRVSFADKLLTKPYSPAELVRRLRALLGHPAPAELETMETPKSDVAPIEWNESFSVGLPALDDDHRVLLNQIKRVQAAAESDEEGLCLDLLDELRDYTQTHFRREEVAMAACAYPGLNNHRQVHQLLVKQIDKMRGQLSRNRLSVRELAEFLKEWLVDHIQRMDGAYARDYRGKEMLIARAMAQAEPPPGQQRPS